MQKVALEQLTPLRSLPWVLGGLGEGTMVCQLGLVPSGASVDVTASVTVIAPDNTVVRDTANVSSGPQDPQPANNSATQGTTICNTCNTG